MKKSTPASRIPQTVDEYLDTVPEPARTTLTKIRAAIRSAVPKDTVETISYRIPTYKYKGMLVCFAAFAKHCSLFLATSSIPEPIREELKDHLASKGTIQFPVDKPLPDALVKKIVKARVAQNEAKKPSR